MVLNAQALQRAWNEVKDKIRERWGEITDDDLAVINGQREQLVGKLRQRYGMAKEEADKQAREFADSCKC